MAALLNLPRDVTRQGFEPAGYLLNREKVLGLQFTRDDPNDKDRDRRLPTTLGEVMAALAARPIQHVETGSDTTTISTDSETSVVRSISFNCELLKTLLDLRKEGVDPFKATWYWYAHGTSVDGTRHAHSFFVVHDKAIVRDGATFVEGPSNGFDFSVFERPEMRPVWTSDEPTDDAWTRLWYRKFYRETQAGQLMTLRPDAPKLHHYPEGQELRRAYAVGDLQTGGPANEVESRLGPAVLRLLQEEVRQLAGIRSRLIVVECAIWLLGAAFVWFLFFRR
jgi:hypothetical protein